MTLILCKFSANDVAPPQGSKCQALSHILAWQPSWSCDSHAANKISFPLPKEVPHKIWLWLAKWFLRRRCLSIVNNGRRQTPDHGYTISSPMSLWLRWAKNGNGLEHVMVPCFSLMQWHKCFHRIVIEHIHVIPQEWEITHGVITKLKQGNSEENYVFSEENYVPELSS